MVKLDHVAIAVPDLDSAVPVWTSLLGVQPGEIKYHESEGVRVVFFRLANVTIELMEPSEEIGSSSLQQFLDRNPRGGLHHLAISSPKTYSSTNSLPRTIKVIDHNLVNGSSAVFYHPKDLNGCLVERILNVDA